MGVEHVKLGIFGFELFSFSCARFGRLESGSED